MNNRLLLLVLFLVGNAYEKTIGGVPCWAYVINGENAIVSGLPSRSFVTLLKFKEGS